MALPSSPQVIQGFFLGRPRIPDPGSRKGTVQASPRGGSALQLAPTLRLGPAGGGQRLPQEVQLKMEALFKADFSDVRVHVGPEASSIGALAFAHGPDLYFAPGQYNPQSPHGQRLLGHELAHVVQQRAGRVRNPFGSGIALVQDHGLEAEAERMGIRAGTATAPSPIQKKDAGTPHAGARPPRPPGHAVPPRTVQGKTVASRLPSPPLPAPSRPPQARANAPAIPRQHGAVQGFLRDPGPRGAAPAPRPHPHPRAIPVPPPPARTPVLVQPRLAAAARAASPAVLQPLFGYDTLGSLRSIGNYVAGAATGAATQVTTGLRDAGSYLGQGVTGSLGYVRQGATDAYNYLREGTVGTASYLASGVMDSARYQREGLTGSLGYLAQGVSDGVGYLTAGSAAHGGYLGHLTGAIGGVRGYLGQGLTGAYDHVSRGFRGTRDYLGGALGGSLAHTRRGFTGTWNHLGAGVTGSLAHTRRGFRGTWDYARNSATGSYNYAATGLSDAFNTVGYFRTAALGLGTGTAGAAALFGLSGLATGGLGTAAFLTPYAFDYLQSMLLSASMYEPEASGYHTTQRHSAWYRRANLRGRLITPLPRSNRLSAMKDWSGKRVDTAATSSQFRTSNWERFSLKEATKRLMILDPLAVVLDYQPNPQAPGHQFTIQYPGWTVGISHTLLGPPDGVSCEYVYSNFIRPGPVGAHPHEYFLVQHFPQTAAHANNHVVNTSLPIGLNDYI